MNQSCLTLLIQLDMNRIRIEAEINRQIDSLYTPENHDRYMENSGNKYRWDEVNYNGITYNNVGKPLEWAANFASYYVPWEDIFSGDYAL